MLFSCGVPRKAVLIGLPAQTASVDAAALMCSRVPPGSWLFKITCDAGNTMFVLFFLFLCLSCVVVSNSLPTHTI